MTGERGCLTTEVFNLGPSQYFGSANLAGRPSSVNFHTSIECHCGASLEYHYGVRLEMMHDTGQVDS